MWWGSPYCLRRRGWVRYEGNTAPLPKRDAVVSKCSLQVLHPSWYCRVKGRLPVLVGHQYWGLCTNVQMIYKFQHIIHITTYRSCYTSIEAISSHGDPSLIVFVRFLQLVSASGGNIPPWTTLPHYIWRGCSLFPCIRKRYRMSEVASGLRMIEET